MWNASLRAITNRLPRCAILIALSPCAAWAQQPSSQQQFHVVEATIDGIHDAMRAGQLTCTRLVQAYLERIRAYDQTGPKLNSIQNVNPDALEQAAKLDAAWRTSGPVGPLHCIPVLMKDEIETDFMPTTYGSAIFKHFMPPRNATIVDRLQAAGAIILAKTNLGEFANGYSGSAFGDCRNPYDPTREPGGSSCGSGASVAANFGAVGIGEDTGGSIRGPASHNSLVGLRPTLPLVSRYGLLPAAPTRDTLGPMTRTVRDAAIVLDAIAGYDPDDPVTAWSYGQIPHSYTSFLQPNGLKGMRFGVLRAMVGKVDAGATDFQDIQGVLTQATKDLTARGAQLVDPVTIPGLAELFAQSGGGLYEAEAAMNGYFAQYASAPVHTLKEIVARPELVAQRRDELTRSVGHSTGEVAYLKEELAREALRVAVLKVMADYKLDAIVYAATNQEPAVIPAIAPAGSIRRLAGSLAFPALGVPAGFTSHKIPVGIEFLGRPYSEGTLFRAAYDYEQTTRHRRPPPTTPPLAGEP